MPNLSVPNLRAALLTVVGIGLIALAVVGIADRNARARLERALRSAPLVRTASSVTALPFPRPEAGR